MMILLNDKKHVWCLVSKTNEFRVSTFERKIYTPKAESKIIFFLRRENALVMIKYLKFRLKYIFVYYTLR